MTLRVPRLPFSFDPLIAEARRRAQRRWLIITLIAALLTGGTAATLALTSPGPPGAARLSASVRTQAKSLVGGIFFIGRVPADLPSHGLEAGVVTVYKGSRHWTQPVERGKQFRFSLPPGIYTATAAIKYGTCAYSAAMGTNITDSLAVRKGHTTRANIYCTWH